MQARHTTLAECLDDYNVEGLTTVSSDWNSIIAPFNLRLPYKPVAVALPKTPAEVSIALKCAKKYGVKVQARGGGHSYGAMALGGQDGSFMIDMNRFNKIEIDPATQIVKVGAGVRLGNLALALYNAGGRALPHGVCPGVGIGGHATHGGFGFTSRMWGIALDKIVKLDVVLANGTITEASSSVNPELFWALRGAGSSFAIVTTFHMQTVQAPSSAISYTVNIPASEQTTVQQKVNIFLAMQEYGLEAPKEIALRLFTTTGAFVVSGVYWGDSAGFTTAIQGLRDRMPAGTTITTTTAGWLDTLKAIAWAQTLEVPLTGYNEHDTFFAKSVVATQSNPQNSSVITSFFNFLATHENTTDFVWWVLADLYGGVHSEINKGSLAGSSYAHRDSLWTWQLYSYTNSRQPPYPAAGITFMNSMAASMLDKMNPEDRKGYVNYVDPTLSAAEAHQFYYGNDKWDGSSGPGEGRLDRLLRIKQQVDPDMLFWNPQAIGA
ncbi:hypothetical protein BDZ91DRAFT_777538 [Kalaharituber pfeilii]|nr:hypothetical protein BDZ91DRAFT_777538 [Kalaharituber pfeilii]